MRNLLSLTLLVGLLARPPVADGSLLTTHLDLTINDTVCDGNRGQGIVRGGTIGLDVTIDTATPGFIGDGFSSYSFAPGSATNLIADIPGVLHTDPRAEPASIQISGRTLELCLSSDYPNLAYDSMHPDWLVYGVTMFLISPTPRSLDLSTLGVADFQNGALVRLILDYEAPSTDSARGTPDIMEVIASNEVNPGSRDDAVTTPEPPAIVALILGAALSVGWSCFRLREV